MNRILEPYAVHLPFVLDSNFVIYLDHWLKVVWVFKVLKDSFMSFNELILVDSLFSEVRNARLLSSLVNHNY